MGGLGDVEEAGMASETVVEEANSFPGVEEDPEDLVDRQAVVRLVGIGMTVAQMIGLIWMDVVAMHVGVDGVGLVIEESFQIGVEVEVTVVAQIWFEHGAAGAAAEAVAEAGAEVAAGAGAGAGVAAEAGVGLGGGAVIARALAQAGAGVAAAAMKETGGLAFLNLIRENRILQVLVPLLYWKLHLHCQLCHQIHFQALSQLGIRLWLLMQWLCLL